MSVDQEGRTTGEQRVKNEEEGGRLVTAEKESGSWPDGAAHRLQGLLRLLGC